MKILLVHPPWLRFFGRFLASPPIALNSIAQYIRREVPDVEIDVYNADHIEGAVEKAYNSYLFARKHENYLKRIFDPNDEVWKEVEQVIKEYQPDIIGVSSMTASYTSALYVSEIAKSIDKKMTVVFGGKHPSALPEDTLHNSSIDFVVIGEGEVTFAELIQSIDSPHNINGIAFRNEMGKIVETKPRSYIEDINTLPLPIFDSSINTYGFEQREKIESYKWKIVSARGCPFRCIYCASDTKIRYRSPQNVLEEIRFVKKEYGITSFDFQDDSFSINKDRALEICELLKKEKISWECNTRVDLIDENLVSNMSAGGCRTVWIGIESGSQKTLEMINKKITEEMILRAIKLFKKYKLFVCGFFIIGFPWETANDMEKTMDLICRLEIDNFELNIATPLPGTKMFSNLIDDKKIDVDKMDWSKIHQGSFEMNFSEYTDDEWKKMIFDFTCRASKIHRKKMMGRLPRLLFQEPLTTLKRIKNQVFSK